MRRTTPELAGSRQSVYRVVSISILVGTIAYVLWTNYVIFVGGNLPLTPINLGDGSTGAGLTMLFIGDLIVVLAVWFLVDSVLLNLVHLLLSTGGTRRPAPVQPVQPVQPGQPPQGQPGQLQGEPPQQWQQPQQYQPPQQWQQAQPSQQWPAQQWQPQPTASGPTTPPPDRSQGDSAQATLIAPQNGWSPPGQR